MKAQLKYEQELSVEPKRPTEWETVATIRKVIRMAPLFLVMSAVGCLLAYFVFSVPANQAAVVVAVPLGFLIVIGRTLLASMTPTPAPKNFQMPSIGFLVSALTLIVSVTMTLDLLLSSCVYSGLGLHNTASGALQAALLFAVLSLLAALCSLLTLRPAARIINALLVLGTIWLSKVLSCPWGLDEKLTMAHHARL